MTKTKVGEKGLRDSDIRERDKLILKLAKAFTEVEQSINNYQKRVDEINGWLDEMRDMFQAYYDDRSDNWKESKDESVVYDSFKDQWDGFSKLEEFEDILENMRDSVENWVSDLEELPDHPDRRTKPRKGKLFSRNL
ncbi:MAG: hypothetical protein DCE90_03230 [Pseudanabaena sp.]|nr:MAG: hypothetical protein DCE90_03230 [Pseudanabaena sp.]